MPHSLGSPGPAAAFTAIDEKIATADPCELSETETSGSLPYWLVNVPRAQWPAECPSYLRDQPDKNIRILATRDEHYKKQNWETVREIISALADKIHAGLVYSAERHSLGTNRIDLFQRVPTELRKYLEFASQIKARYGSMLRFVVRERLRWGDGDDLSQLKPKGRLFEYDEDIRILYNDWPYGVEDGIIHLVVWTKFNLEEDPATGDLTPRARKEIDNYVKQTFCLRVPSEKIIWFKNWKSLKSIHSVEHFHVMINNPDMDFIREITQGDMPLVSKV